MSANADTHEYTDEFFDYITAGSLASARVVCPLLVDWLRPRSLLDVGSGAGAWCKIWKEKGIETVVGVDGEYVHTEALLIPEASFHRQDLSQSFDLGRRFDLVTSLEVAEHVAESSADVFVDNLVRHGDRVVFSAAVEGQGGEFHVNEQPLSYWRARFAARGFRCFDAVRPQIVADRTVEPWYRYNTLLYVHERAVGELPVEVSEAEIGPGQPIPNRAPLSWQVRNVIIGSLPQVVVDGLVALKHTWARRRGAAE